MSDIPMSGEVVRLWGEDGLTARLCRAVGLDPDEVSGFDLRVRGGELPELVVQRLPPMTGNQLTDDWLEPLEQVAETYHLVPAEAPEL